jgi:hypothetical protein
MSGFEIFFIIVALGLLVIAWAPLQTKSRRVTYTITATWAGGVVAIYRIYGDIAAVPFLVLSALIALVWLVSIVWLPKHSQAPKFSLSPLKGFLLGLFGPVMCLVIGLLDRDHRDGWFFGIAYFGVVTVHEYLERLWTESKPLPRIEP